MLIDFKCPYCGGELSIMTDELFSAIGNGQLGMRINCDNYLEDRFRPCGKSFTIDAGEATTMLLKSINERLEDLESWRGR